MYRLGGRPRPQDKGLDLTHRDALWERISSFTEGHIFKIEDIINPQEEHSRAMKANFHAMKDYDVLHLGSGYYVGVIETQYNRLSPDPHKVAKNWAKIHDWEICEFGDWTAWREKMTQQEPISGYRFRVCEGRVDESIVLGHMKIKFITGPKELMQDTAQSKILRSLCDTPIGTKMKISGWFRTHDHPASLWGEVIELAKSLESSWENTPLQGRGRKPMEAIKGMAPFQGMENA